MNSRHGASAVTRMLMICCRDIRFREICWLARIPSRRGIFSGLCVRDVRYCADIVMLRNIAFYFFLQSGGTMMAAPFVKREQLRPTLHSRSVLVATAGLLLCAIGCGKEATVNAPPAKAPESQVQVSATANAALVTTPAADFAIAPIGV